MILKESKIVVSRIYLEMCVDLIFVSQCGSYSTVYVIMLLIVAAINRLLLSESYITAVRLLFQ